MKNKELKEWDKATDNLAKYFIKKYFGKDYSFENYAFWVGSLDEDREVLAVGDYIFDLNDIVSFIRYNYSRKEVFKYYDYALDCYDRNKKPINIKNWKKFKKLN